jgi:hypothetical protein
VLDVARPGTTDFTQGGTLTDAPIAADDTGDALQLARRPLVQLDDVVKGLGNLTGDPVWSRGKRTEKSPRRAARNAASS